jgi:SAM-dependent methyltransferase
LARSVSLFRAFLREQSDPDHFYGVIADDTMDLVRRHTEISGRTVLDVGGGPGYYTRAFRAAGARCLLADADARELTSRGHADPAAVRADARQLPLADGSVDIAFSSNLLEHVARPWFVADELARVVRPGGLLVLSYTIWLGPWGGHETSPWHYLGGHRARRRYERTWGRPPKNRFGSGLFATSAAEGVRWARGRRGFDVLELRPRYLPAWSAGLVRVPGLREVVTWNLWAVLRRREVPMPAVTPW